MDDPVRIVLVGASVGAAIAIAVAAAVFLVVRRVRRDRQSPTDAGLALAAGFVAGCVGVSGLPKLPLVEAHAWLVPIAIACAIVGAIGSWVPARPAAVCWGLRLVVVAFAVSVTVLQKTPLWLGGMSAATAAFLGSVAGVARRAGAGVFLAVVLIVAIGTAVSVGIYSATFAQLCGALAAATGACLMLSWRFPMSADGAVLLAGVMLAAFWMNGVLYAEMPVLSAVLLAAAMPAAWGAHLALAAQSPRKRTVLTLLAALLLAGAGVAVAVAEAPPLDF